MGKQLPNDAEVVIVGGGVIGCSIAYHLTKIGVSDVVLLERKQLTSGTTWHAAGLIGQLRDSKNMTELAKYTAELYLGLEEETQQATGYKINGSLSLATTKGRMEDLVRRADLAKVFGLRVDVVGPLECRDMYPLISTDGIIGGTYIPTDGQADPVGVTQALAKGARNGGAQIFENVLVENVIVEGGCAVGVSTKTEDIKARHVVLASGMWTRQLAGQIGIRVPLHACEHFYILTEPFSGVTPNLPVLRDYDACAYFKEDAGKILLGAFEPIAKPWGMDGIPEDFSFDELPGDFEHFEPILMAAVERMPALEHAGIQTFFCGPESFTPDDKYQIGPVPEVDNLFIAAGMNSIGIQSAGGVGKVLADWIKDGYPPMDIVDVDIRRNMPFQSNAKYLHDRVSETLGLLYAVHWPFYQYQTSRSVRSSPLHQKHVEARACFGEVAGWERPNWFAPEGVSPDYEYSFERQNWFEYSKAEHLAVRAKAGIIDLSSFAKFRLQGRDSEGILNWICANNVPTEPGHIVYTQWLNGRGGIEADLTVTRVAENDFLIVTSPGGQVRDFHWLQSHIPHDSHAFATDVTSSYAVLAVMGPDARNILQSLTPSNLSNQAFPFAASREIELGYGYVRASRITYVGELGWELYVPTEFASGIYDTLMDGANGKLVPVGMHAVNSLRIEKGYKHWGHDITDEDTPLEAGLGFAIAWDKQGGFNGRDALIKRRERVVNRVFLQFLLEDPFAMLYHNEPIYRDGEIVGYLTSGAYGHSLGGSVGLGYVDCIEGISSALEQARQYQIEVAGEKIAAKPSLTPIYDPKSHRIRG
ncbi:MAG: FAD-dependent oxidoreductase [Rhodospirillaceae bacterium TMED8]|nr:FAD-dependent oxidoreductase [Magnetovibrio sp.]OUT48984.1 MAG: FAD-dependent oxidoreductase [Rhodospirillaceae bacterium TMED8]